jgi:hypothetical protein
MLPVLRENMEMGKLYYIQALKEDDYRNIIPNENLSIMVGIFKHLQEVNSVITWNAAVFDWFEISNMKEMKDESESHKYVIREVELNYMWSFYEVKKFKIQNDMEMRTLNLILRDIIGDPYFTV